MRPMTTAPLNRSVLSKVGWVVTGLALTLATCVASVAVNATVAHASVATHITPDADTVVLDHFDGTSAGTVYGSLGYADSLDGLGQAGVFGEGVYTKYNVSAVGSAQGTVEMWVKPAGPPTGYIHLLDFNWSDVGSYPPAGHVLHWGLQSDATQAGSFWGWGTDGSNGTVGTTPVCSTGDCWTHIAFSWGPAGSKTYVNGRLDGYDPRPSGPSSPQWAYLNDWGGTNHFDGLVDEFQVSKVQRTDAEILAHATLSDPRPIALTKLSARTFIATDTITLQATLGDHAPGVDVAWTVIGNEAAANLAGFPAGAVRPTDSSGVSTFSFSPAANPSLVDDRHRNWTGGSRTANPPISFEVVASVQIDGSTHESRLSSTDLGPLEQDETDRLRQEYYDYGLPIPP